GLLLARLGKRAEAEAEHRQALALARQLAADFPGVLDYQIELSCSHHHLGCLVRDNGRPADALPWFDQAVGGLAPVLERQPRLASARRFLRNGHGGRAQALMKLDRHADAARDWDRALELDDGSLRVAIRLQRALCLARVEPTKAVAEAEALLQ